MTRASPSCLPPSTGRDPRREIAVRADRRLSYAEVKRVLRIAREAGFPAVGLVAERPAAKR